MCTHVDASPCAFTNKTHAEVKRTFSSLFVKKKSVQNQKTKCIFLTYADMYDNIHVINTHTDIHISRHT